MKEIKLTDGSIAFVDDDDFDKINALKWYLKKGKRTNYAESTTKPYVKMHRLIVPSVLKIDHIDRNGLNNTKVNLRAVKDADNAKNTPKYSNNTSGFKGVHFTKDRPRIKPWRAMIKLNGRNKSLGYYEKPEDAARAYDRAAREHFGEFCGELNYE